MTIEEREAKIRNIISDIAMTNPYVTPEQIEKASERYLKDYRPLVDIQAELMEYSKSIKAAGLERERMQAIMADKNHPSKPKLNMPQVSENDSDENISNNQGNSAPPSEDQSVGPAEAMEEDLADLYDEPIYQSDMTGRLGIVTSDSSTSDPTDDLEAMFESPQTQSDFGVVDSLEPGKRLIKNLNNTTEPKSESGFSSADALLTIATIFSIMGIVISMVIIYVS